MSSLFKADLHCHSCFSDGILPPHELVALAKSLGIEGLAITDHDDIQSYAAALPTAKALGIRLLPGVEFSTKQGKHPIHVLAYSFQVDHPRLKELSQFHQERRLIRNLAMLKKLAEKGLPVTLEECSTGQPFTIGRPHIAMAMIKRGYVSSLQEAFKKWLGETAPCYVEGPTLSTEETLKAIHEAKGLAVLAHPHLITHSRCVKELLTLPFDGLETYYSRMGAHDNQKWADIAKEKGWLTTGGSDFHGIGREKVVLGCAWTSMEIFEKIESHFLNSHSRLNPT